MSEMEFEQLVADWLDGQISPEGVRALEQQLLSSPEARADFRRYAKLDTALQDVADGGPDFADVVNQEAALRASAKTSFATVAESLTRHRWKLSLAIAASVLIAAGLFRGLSSPEGPIAGGDTDPNPTSKSAEVTLVSMPPAPLATLTSQEDAAWEGTPIADGQALCEGETIRLQRGKARVSVGVGAEIAMVGPCDLTFVNRARVELGDGQVTVHVAEWAKGFTVATDAMDVVDLGTTFTVSASRDNKDQTRVIKGLVRVHPRLGEDEQQRGLLVSEGEALTINQGSMRKDVDDPSWPQVDLLGVEGVRPYRPIAVHNTGLGLGVGDEDPHWRVIAGPEGSFKGPHYVAVCAPDERYMANDPETSQWVSMENWQSAVPDSVYTFETTLDLTGYELSTSRLFGRFLADNGIEAVRVNGKLVGYLV